MFSPAPSSRLEKLTGFFSSLDGAGAIGATGDGRGGAATEAISALASYVPCRKCLEGALTKGRGCFVAGGKVKGKTSERKDGTTESAEGKQRLRGIQSGFVATSNKWKMSARSHCQKDEMDGCD